MARSDRTPKARTAGDDVVLVHGRSDDGRTLAVLRKRGDTLSAGLLTAAEEGKPLHGDLLRLTPREDAPFLADVEVLHESARAERPNRDGPAQVSTPAYREGWNAVFGTSRPSDAERAVRPAGTTGTRPRALPN